MNINILVICQDDGLIEKIHTVFKEFNEIDYQIKAFNYPKLLNFLLETSQSFDALLIHGIFNQTIAEKTVIPTFYLRENITDILMPIKLCEKELAQTIIFTTDLFADEVKKLLDALSSSVPVVPCHSWHHFSTELFKLKDSSYSKIIVDSYLYPLMTLTTYETYTFRISHSAIKRQLMQIIETIRPIKKYKLYQAILSSILQNEGIDFAIFDPKHQLLFDQVTDDTAKVLLPSMSIIHPLETAQHIKQHQYHFEKEVYNIHYLNRKENITNYPHRAITECSPLELRKKLPYSYLRPLMVPLIESLSLRNQFSNHQSYIIYGEPHTLKTVMASELMNTLNKSSQHCYLIDCRLIDLSWWDFLTHYLDQESASFLFQHVEALNEVDCEQLVKLCHTKNRPASAVVILLYETDEHYPKVLDYLFQTFFPIYMPNLNLYSDFEQIIRLMTHH